MDFALFLARSRSFIGANAKKNHYSLTDTFPQEHRKPADTIPHVRRPMSFVALDNHSHL